MTSIRIVFSTIDSEENARKMARHLVEEHLAACVNIVSNVSSVYKWEGVLEEEKECLLIIKTSENRLEELITRIVESHPYEVPDVVAFPIEKGYSSYLEWVISETRGS